MNTRKQVKLAALKKEAEHYCCNFTINIQIKKQKNISFYRKKWRMARKKYKKTKKKEQLWIKSFFQTTVQLIHAYITRYHTYKDLEVVVTSM